jgi:hypothetical protein
MQYARGDEMVMIDVIGIDRRIRRIVLVEDEGPLAIGCV